MADQVRRLAYAHGSRIHDRAARDLRGRASPTCCRVDDPAIYPVSGGSEAIETALKLARVYHLARGEPDRGSCSSRDGGATTATRWARWTCRAVGPLRRARTRAGSADSGTSPRRIRIGPDEPGAHALGDGEALAAELERAIELPVPDGGRVRRRADRRRHARRGRPARRLLAGDRRRLPRHGVLLIADEVMTGFGRTGRWFGLDHWGVRPDILVAAKGATVRVLAVRLRRRRPDAVYETVTAPGTGSSTASRTRIRRSGRPSLARCCGSSTRSVSSRRARTKGDRLMTLLEGPWKNIRRSARSGVAG